MNKEIINGLKERAKEMLNNDYSRKIGDEEIYTIICEWEKTFDLYKKEQEKNKRIGYRTFCIGRRNGKSKVVLEEYISKDKIKEKIKYYYDIDNIVGVRILENLMEENDK